MSATRSSRASHRRGDKGAVLVVVLLVMMALLGLGLTGLYLTTGSIQMNANINMRNQALQVAEAGIQRAKEVLNRRGLPGWDPNISGLLSGTTSPGNQSLTGLSQDAIPATTDDCLGGVNFQKGAVLRDEPGSVVGCETNSAYLNCALTAMTDPTDPNTPRSLGTYTVYIRQDQAECRLGGNLNRCENGRGSGSTLACVDGIGNSVTSNGIVVIRSEGVASDNRTMVALEVTMARNPNPTTADTRLATVCPAGQAGCDDNASVQQGITVSGALTPPPPPPPGTGSGVDTGTGTSATSATSTSSTTSTGTGTSGPGTTGTSTSVGTGTGSGTGTRTSTSTSTATAGTSTSTSTSTNTFPCLNYAVQAVGPCSSYSPPPGCITVNSNTIVDSFNRAAGPYGPANKFPASVAMVCNQSSYYNTCNMNCSSCVSGTINYGVPGDKYTKDTLKAPNCASMNWGQNAYPPPANATLSPGCYNEVSLNVGGTLTLTAGSYVVNSLNLNSNRPPSISTLFIDDTNGPVRLWVLNSGGVAPNSVVKVKSGNPANFWLIYNGTGEVQNNTGNEFTGVIFAPQALVHINFNITGAVIAGQVVINDPGKVHFDTTLKCL